MSNTQVNSLLNEAYAMFTGSEDIGTLTTQGIIDAGGSTLAASREKFTGALINVIIKNEYTDTEYRDRENDVFYEDAETYGAIKQLIAVEIPKAISNPAWANFVSAYDDPTNATRLHDTPIYVPVVSAKFYEGSVSWAIPITITGQQWDTAVHSAGELETFVGYLRLAVRNGIEAHKADMERINRNNYIAEKLNYAASAGASGIHKINLIQAAIDDGVIAAPTGAETVTAEDFMSNGDAMRYATEVIKLYKGYFQQISVLFNTAGAEKFTPENRLVLQVLGKFARRLETVALSDTYHKDIVDMPLYREVASWQGLGSDTSWSNISTIDLNIGIDDNNDDIVVTQSGIVALLVDKWAIMHTIKSRRVGVDRDDIKDLTLEVAQFRDGYYNNLDLNGLVFTLETVTA